jgi:hypothetical protein
LPENKPLSASFMYRISENKRVSTLKQITVTKMERNLPVSKDFHFLGVDQILYGAIQSKMTLGTLQEWGYGDEKPDHPNRLQSNS